MTLIRPSWNSVDPMRPWKGRGPLADLTGDTAAKIEKQASRMSSVPVAPILSFPDKLSASQTSELQDRFIKATEKAAKPLVVDRGATAGKPLAPPWEPGFPTMRGQIAAHVAQSYGLGPSFFEGDAPGALMREAWRQFLNGTLAPIARMIERETERKTGQSLKIDLSALRIIDIQAAAKTYAAFIEAGMSEAEALERAGLADD